MKHLFKWVATLRPERTVVIGYFACTLLGWLILLLPICHKKSVPPLDNFFTALSAVSTTGLSTVDVGTVYSFFGQIIIFLLFQVGGIGYMTFISFMYLAIRNKLQGITKKIASATFSLPKDFNIHQFLFHVVTFTLCCEFLGAIALSIIFSHHGIAHPIWNGVFHSVSAFCTAGFSLFSDSFVGFKYDIWVNLTLGLLSILGGSLGFIVWLDVYKRMKGERKRLLFTTKVIIAYSIGLIFMSTWVFFLVEGSDSSSSFYQRILSSFFQVMTAATTVGFNTLDIGNLGHASIILLFFLMFFGASPSGTGGGLKCTTLSALVAIVKCTLQRKSVVTLWRHEIGIQTVRLATASFTFYMFVILTAVFFLDLTDTKHFMPVLFETVSAMGNVGLSMGITSDLTVWGKGIICLLMLMGRAGVLTFAIAISNQLKEEEPYIKEAELVT
jgi:trk system potassium uptake protein TrkH